MQNQTLLQYFHWYYNEPENLWVKAEKEAARLAEMGITKVWFPPLYKGTDGDQSIGYDTYDLFDLGEFDQKNSINTKYGSKAELLKAIQELNKNKIGVIADAVFNHKAGGDELEKITVKKVNPDQRNEFISDEFEIEAWTKFTFPGRNGKYSDFIWDHQCFSGVDWAEDLQETAIYSIQNQYGEGWEKVPSNEFGNFDYLMYSDIDFRNPAVREELKKWGKWIFETCKLDGFRLDAVKHISHKFLIEWIDFLKQECRDDLFFVSENWTTTDLKELEDYIQLTQGKTQLFDTILHANFYEASINGNEYDLSKILENTLISSQPLLAVTFVDNHDSQPLQALDSFVEFWFRPLAYAIILLREQGTPCVFYTDIYGAVYEEDDNKVEIIGLEELPQLLNARKKLAYGFQRDYLDHPNCIGWTREGNEEHENSGLAVLMSNGEEGIKSMEIGKGFAGKIFVDALQNRNEEIKIDENGWGEFYCNGGSVSVWVLKEVF